MALDDNILLDIAANVRIAANVIKDEGRINGRKNYYRGRVDAYRAVEDGIREKLRLTEAEFQSRLDERFAFRMVSKFIPTKTLKDYGRFEAYDDGRYTIICKEGRIIDVEEDSEYNQRLREK